MRTIQYCRASNNKISGKPDVVVRPGALFLSVIVLVLSCVVFGILSFNGSAWLARNTNPSAFQNSSGIAYEVEQQLIDNYDLIKQQKTELQEVRQLAESQMDALTSKLGLIQAQMVRINALGQRLTSISGLDTGEFNFHTQPGIGSAENAAGTESIKTSEFIDTLDTLAVQLDRNEQQLSVLEALYLNRDLNFAQQPTGWPMDGGWISSHYGYRRDPFNGKRNLHRGVDIVHKEGSEIKAVAAGVVSFSGSRKYSGITIDINHGNQYMTRYGHASKALVKAGQRVNKGQVIAIVGSTGRSTGTHLHFEVHKNKKRVGEC